MKIRRSFYEEANRLVGMGWYTPVSEMSVDESIRGLVDESMLNIKIRFSEGIQRRLKRAHPKKIESLVMVSLSFEGSREVSMSLENEPDVIEMMSDSIEEAG
jgi:hypothetical protein